VEELRLLVYPLPVALILMLLGAIGLARGGRLAGFLFFLVFFAVGAAATEPVSQFLVDSLEGRYPAVAVDEVDTADAIVVLGGGVLPAMAPGREPQLAAAGDRLRAAHALYAAERAPRVITTGGPPLQRVSTATEAQAAGLILQGWGVPEDAIMPRGESRSTRGDLQTVRSVMAVNDFDSLLLVTSALHMPRAMALFDQTGLDVTPVPANFVGHGERARHWSDYVPNARNLWLTRVAVH